MDSESLWLQNSINLADPFNTSQQSSDGDKSSNLSTKDLDLIGKQPVGGTDAVSRVPIRTTTQFRSSVRMSSVCNSMLFPSTTEIDEMKAKLVQLQREKLKWEDTSRDLDRSKAELVQSKEDYKVLEEYSKKIKTTADESAHRAERDAKARQEAEAKLVETVLNSTRDVQQLKQQMDEAQKKFSHDIFELKEEHNSQLATLGEENAVVVAELKDSNEVLQQDIANKERQWKDHTKQLRDMEEQMEKSHDEYTKKHQQLKEHQQSLENQMSLEREQFAAQQRELQSKADAIKEQKHAELVDLQQDHAKQTKVLTMKIEDLEQKFEKARDDFFTVRSQMQDKADQLQRLHTEKELEIKKLCDTHRSAVLEQKIQFEEDLQSSRSQLRASAEELSELKKLNTKLEGELGVARSQNSEKDREVTTLRRDLSNAEQRLESAIAEVHNLTAQLEQTEGWINRMTNEHDTTHRGMEEDLNEAREKTKRTEAEVLQLQKDLSAQRREFMMADVEHRKVNEELAAKYSALQQRSGTEQSDQVRQLHHDKKAAEETASHLNASVSDLRKKLQQANEELLQEMSRREVAERQLDAKRSVAKTTRTVSLSPMPLTVLNELTNNRQSSEPPLKRARSEAAMRIFAITGFKSDEAQRIRDDILTMPSTSVVGASNLPVPTEVTHMISSDALTIKLLTAAARGCWILPLRYVTDSLAAGRLLDEYEYGFQHKALPFLHKRIAFTSSFKHEKQHYQSAKIISEAGGALVVSEQEECDFLVQGVHENIEGPTLTWDSLVRLIYPTS